MDLRGHDAGAEDKIEKEADDMAIRGLIPQKVWDQKPLGSKATVLKVYTLAEKLKIHPAIITGRIRYEQNNYKLLSRHVGRGMVRGHFAEDCLKSVVT